MSTPKLVQEAARIVAVTMLTKSSELSVEEARSRLFGKPATTETLPDSSPSRAEVSLSSSSPVQVRLDSSASPAEVILSSSSSSPFLVHHEVELKDAGKVAGSLAVAGFCSAVATWAFITGITGFTAWMGKTNDKSSGGGANNNDG